MLRLFFSFYIPLASPLSSPLIPSHPTTQPQVPEFLLDLQWWLPFKEVKRLAAAFPQSRVARDEFALILRIKAMQGAAAVQESIAYMATMKAAGPPVHMQLHNLAMRNTSALLRHPLLLGVNVLSALGVGLLCGVGLDAKARPPCKPPEDSHPCPSRILS